MINRVQRCIRARFRFSILLEQLLELQRIDAGASRHAIEESWLKSAQSGFSKRSICFSGFARNVQHLFHTAVECAGPSSMTFRIMNIDQDTATNRRQLYESVEIQEG